MVENLESNTQLVSCEEKHGPVTAAPLSAKLSYPDLSIFPRFILEMVPLIVTRSSVRQVIPVWSIVSKTYFLLGFLQFIVYYFTFFSQISITTIQYIFLIINPIINTRFCHWLRCYI